MWERRRSVDIRKGTEEFEGWLRGQVPVVEADLRAKHVEMANSRFEFLRGTFYRWAQLWHELAEDQGTKTAFTRAPTLLGVGDLHVENFGTWRDREGRWVWGVNDFDEAYVMPYTNDLVRLATSTKFAVKQGDLKLGFGDACQAILQGYTEGLGGGRPFILAEDHDWLRDIALQRLLEPSDPKEPDEFDEFWRELRDLERVEPAQAPPAAVEALRQSFEEPLEFFLARRAAGLGSLGRARFVAVVEDWCGGVVAREVKVLAPSVWPGVGGASGPESVRYEEILAKAVRCHDPMVRVHRASDDGGYWIVRRLAPDAGKVKLAEFPHKRLDDMLRAMGRETANIHLGSRAAIEAIRTDLATRTAVDSDWLRKAANRMAELTEADYDAWKSGWKSWRKAWDTPPPPA